jgi:pathogenesis-related protein 1
MQRNIKVLSTALLLSLAAIACETADDTGQGSGAGGSVASQAGSAAVGTSPTNGGAASTATGSVSAVGGNWGSAGGATSPVTGASPGGSTTSATGNGGTSSNGGTTSTGGTTSATTDPTCPEGNDAFCGIVAAHNAARADVSPVPTTPLPSMSWDATAASAAQTWANACTWSHNAGNYGQNMYAVASLDGSDAPAPGDIVDDWVSEKQYYTYATNSCATGQMCGHYT